MKDYTKYRLTEDGIKNLTTENHMNDMTITVCKNIKYNASEETLKHLNCEIKRCQSRNREIHKLITNCVVVWN